MLTARTVGKIDDQHRGPAAFGGLAGQHLVGLGGQRGGAVAGAAAQGGDDVVMDAGVILSFRVIRRCDLWRPVLDSVADGTLAA